MKSIVLILTLLIAVWVTAQPQTSQTVFLKKLEGSWQAKGTSFGMPSDVEMTWVSMLGGRYTQIQYKVTMHGKEGKDQVFEGTAYYKLTGSNEYKATWFDSGGEMHPTIATHDDTTLTSLWGTPESKMGKSVYRLIDENTVEVSDLLQMKDGMWREFAKNVLKRK